MSLCTNCGRELRGYVMGAETWLSLFCSPMCRDTAGELRRYEQMKKLEKHARPRPTFLEQCDSARDELIAKGVNVRASEFLRDEADRCGIDGCHVCSGAMRERKGDANG